MALAHIRDATPPVSSLALAHIRDATLPTSSLALAHAETFRANMQ